MVSTFGVEKIKREPGLPEGGEPEFDWNRFRTFARLDKKTDESLSRYFRSFVAMCRRVCHLRPGRGEGNHYSTRFRSVVVVAAQAAATLNFCLFAVGTSLFSCPQIRQSSHRLWPPSLRSAPRVPFTVLASCVASVSGSCPTPPWRSVCHWLREPLSSPLGGIYQTTIVS